MTIHWENWSAWFKGAAIFQTNTGDFRVVSAIWLLLLILVPIVMFSASWIRRRYRATMLFPGADLLVALSRRSNAWRGAVLSALRVVALVLLIFAAARPQFGNIERQTYSDGIDIMLIADLSLSMSAKDFYPNRLEASKTVMEKFVSGRVGDRIGLTVFASEAAPMVPMTMDYNVVKAFISKLDFNVIDGKNTAIGMGLATALKKIKESDAKTKIIILLTDGENNAGNIDPMAAAEAAKTSGVRVYTIGVGSDNSNSMSFFQRTQMPGIDETMLTQIAEMTGGAYFRATDNMKLGAVYDQIDKLEKSKVETTQFDNFSELAPYFIALALLALFVQCVLRFLVWRQLP